MYTHIHKHWLNGMDTFQVNIIVSWLVPMMMRVNVQSLSVTDSPLYDQQQKSLILTLSTRSHPEMVDNMLHVTLNFDLSKIPFVLSSHGQDLYSHQKLNMYIYWFSSESGYRR